MEWLNCFKGCCVGCRRTFIKTRTSEVHCTKEWNGRGGSGKNMLCLFLNFSRSGCGRVSRLKTQFAYWQDSRKREITWKWEKTLWVISAIFEVKTLRRHNADKECTLIKPELFVWMCVYHFPPEEFFFRGTTVHLSCFFIGFWVISPAHFSSGVIDAVVMVSKSPVWLISWPHWHLIQTRRDARREENSCFIGKMSAKSRVLRIEHDS